MSNGGDMFDPRRPLGRLFYVLLVVLMMLPSSQAQSPGTTTINEVRWSDTGWGPDNDRNLVGRFSTQTFVLPRLTKVQNYFLRQYDSSVPPRHSRYTAALNLDYPL
jgi:hypothetical protein